MEGELFREALHEIMEEYALVDERDHNEGEDNVLVLMMWIGNSRPI